jgi:pimeloyl-ACP methyl ester carboxylesterase
VLIHGGPGFTSDYLADDLVPMARRHAFLVYDQRGIGRSTLVSDSTALWFTPFFGTRAAVSRMKGNVCAGSSVMPYARLLELKGIGHFPYLEAPEAFHTAVDQFLRGNWPQQAIR